MRTTALLLYLDDHHAMLLFAMSALFTLLHVAEELVGDGGPLWRYFGAIAGLRIPDAIGFVLFTVGLAAALIVVAWLGYVGGSALWLGVLLGARVGDSVFSHWLLVLEWKPNPGIATTVLFAVEVALVIALGLPASPTGFLLGATFFAAIVPVLRLIAFVIGEKHER